MQNKGLNVSVRSFITAIAVIFALMIAAFVLANTIPGGEFARIEDANGNMLQSSAVSDFYISTYGFKKIVTNFVSLMNGEEFDLESGYDF